MKNSAEAIRRVLSSKGAIGSDGRTNYTATIVDTGLHLDSNAETYGGVISEQTP